MQQIPLSLKLSKAMHERLKSSPISMSKQVGEALWKATIHDVVSAIVTRYDSDDVPDDVTINTKVVISQQAMQNLELLSFKTGIMKDPMARLILENYLTNKPKQHNLQGANRSKSGTDHGFPRERGPFNSSNSKRNDTAR